MKLWKNMFTEKKYISRQDNTKDIMTFKSTKLVNHPKKNISDKKVTFETKKSLNTLNNSPSVSSIGIDLSKEQNKKNENDNNEKEKKENTIQINLAEKKFNDLKILSTSDDFFSNKEKKSKTIYPTISNFNTNRKDTILNIY